MTASLLLQSHESWFCCVSRSVDAYVAVNWVCSCLWDQSHQLGPMASSGLWGGLLLSPERHLKLGKLITRAWFQCQGPVLYTNGDSIIQVFKKGLHRHGLVFQALLYLIKPSSWSKFLFIMVQKTRMLKSADPDLAFQSPCFCPTGPSSLCPFPPLPHCSSETSVKKLSQNVSYLPE